MSNENEEETTVSVPDLSGDKKDCVCGGTGPCQCPPEEE